MNSISRMPPWPDLMSRCKASAPTTSRSVRAFIAATSMSIDGGGCRG